MINLLWYINHLIRKIGWRKWSILKIWIKGIKAMWEKEILSIWGIYPSPTIISKYLCYRGFRSCLFKQKCSNIREKKAISIFQTTICTGLRYTFVRGFLYYFWYALHLQQVTTEIHILSIDKSILIENNLKHCGKANTREIDWKNSQETFYTVTHIRITPTSEHFLHKHITRLAK